MQLIQSMLDILKAPVAGSLDTKQIFLLVGLVLVCIAAWVMILRAFDHVVAEV